MSDTEMSGGVALSGASPTHSQLAERINGGAMDMSNGAMSVADSTVSGRLYVSYHNVFPHTTDKHTIDQSP